ncbi:MAG TPA: hypothetical protein VG734_19450 [Lacunisphaera sp.]|nr:hypothetical protein [Lacunisphaera sp.]
MPDKKYSRNGNVRARLDDETRRRLTAVNKRYGTIDTFVVEQLLIAFCDAVEAADAVRWPVVVMLAEKRAMAAEDPPKTEAKTGEKAGGRGAGGKGSGDLKTELKGMAFDELARRTPPGRS